MAEFAQKCKEIFFHILAKLLIKINKKKSMLRTVDLYNKEPAQALKLKLFFEVFYPWTTVKIKLQSQTRQTFQFLLNYRPFRPCISIILCTNYKICKNNMYVYCVLRTRNRESKYVDIEMWSGGVLLYYARVIHLLWRVFISKLYCPQ